MQMPKEHMEMEFKESNTLLQMLQPCNVLNMKYSCLEEKITTTYQNCILDNCGLIDCPHSTISVGLAKLSFETINKIINSI